MACLRTTGFSLLEYVKYIKEVQCLFIRMLLTKVFHTDTVLRILNQFELNLMIYAIRSYTQILHTR